MSLNVFLVFFWGKYIHSAGILYICPISQNLAKKHYQNVYDSYPNQSTNRLVVNIDESTKNNMMSIENHGESLSILDDKTHKIFPIGTSPSLSLTPKHKIYCIISKNKKSECIPTSSRLPNWSHQRNAKRTGSIIWNTRLCKFNFSNGTFLQQM